LSYSQTQTGAYALVLGESAGKRRLPIIIGNFEAQAIAIELEKMRPSRPLTHDIFKTLSDEFHISVTEVVIHTLKEGIFFAKLICKQEGKTEEKEIDTRTSDAIALAVRFGCPIYTYENILSSAGIVLEDEDFESEPATEPESIESTDQVSEESQGLKELTATELEQELDKALAAEDYERATSLRDEMKKRK